MTRLFGLLGEGISRSRQPRLLSHLARLAGIELSYELIDRSDAPDFDIRLQIDELREAGFEGINVTHPFKQRVAPLVTRNLGQAEPRIGTYNALSFEQDGILGANTDYTGFKNGYQHHRGNTPPGHVLICGAGGVGRAIAIGLAELGATELVISDINEHSAASLVNTLEALGHHARQVPAHELAQAMALVDGLVNCTAQGMHVHPESAFPVQHIGSQSWAFDAVYTPLHTEFVIACEKSGLDVVSGFNLWIFQGVDSFRILTGADVTIDRQLLETALSWLD